MLSVFKIVGIGVLLACSCLAIATLGSVGWVGLRPPTRPRARAAAGGSIDLLRFGGR